MIGSAEYSWFNNMVGEEEEEEEPKRQNERGGGLRWEEEWGENRKE